MKIYPAHFCAVTSSVLKCLVFACVFLLLEGSALIDAAPPGFMEGHLKIVSPKEVELADETPSKIIAQNYTDYPLIILSRDGEKEIARVTADRVEIIASPYRREIMFLMFKAGDLRATFARNSNHSRSFQIRRCAWT